MVFSSWESLWETALAANLPTAIPLPAPSRCYWAITGIGAIAALWMAIFPISVGNSGIYKSIPLGPRIPLLALILCLPASFVLSLLTPLAIKLGLPDVSKTGRVAGMVFALGTLGCLVGNYLTGFHLIPSFTINTLVFVSAGTLAALSVGSLALMGSHSPTTTSQQPPDDAVQIAIAPSLPENRTQGRAFKEAFCFIELTLCILGYQAGICHRISGELPGGMTRWNLC